LLYLRYKIILFNVQANREVTAVTVTTRWFW